MRIFLFTCNFNSRSTLVEYFCKKLNMFFVSCNEELTVINLPKITFPYDSCPADNPGQQMSVQVVCSTHILRIAIIWKFMTVKIFIWYGKRIKLLRVWIWRVYNGRKLPEKKIVRLSKSKMVAVCYDPNFCWNTSFLRVSNRYYSGVVRAA